MVQESNENVFLIQIDASSFAEFDISEFEISRFDCMFVWQMVAYCSTKVLCQIAQIHWHLLAHSLMLTVIDLEWFQAPVWRMLPSQVQVLLQQTKLPFKIQWNPDISNNDSRTCISCLTRYYVSFVILHSCLCCAGYFNLQVRNTRSENEVTYFTSQTPRRANIPDL